jgi:hypothetical protein
VHANAPASVCLGAAGSSQPPVAVAGLRCCGAYAAPGPPIHPGASFGFALGVATILPDVRNTIAFLKRTIRALRFSVTDPRIPKPLRWLAALGLLPIPGPFDEAVLLIVAVPLGLFYRRPLADAWRRAGDPRFARPS